MRLLMLPSIIAIAMLSACHKPSSYEECVLERLKGGQSEFAAQTINNACANLYSSSHQNKRIIGFDVAAAKKAGYSEARIADYLGKEIGFDTARARSSGASDADIIEYIISNMKKPRLSVFAKNEE